MAFFKINGIDYSIYVNELIINKEFNYNAQTNAAGNTVVDVINAKREIEVGIIPLSDRAMQSLLNAIDDMAVSISFRNPITNSLEEDVSCIIPASGVEYYTIQAGKKVMYKAFKLKIQEL